VRTAIEISESALQIFEGYRLGRTPPAAIKTGLRDLDDVIAIEPGMLVIVAARPAMGKTSLLTHIALNAAGVRSGVFFVSLETAGARVAVRAVCSMARIDSWRVRARQLSEREWNLLTDTTMQLGNLPLQVDEAPEQTMSAIRSKARRAGAGRQVRSYLYRLLAVGEPAARAGYARAGSGGNIARS
jgi:replicative DNA helicase